MAYALLNPNGAGRGYRDQMKRSEMISDLSARYVEFARAVIAEFGKQSDVVEQRALAYAAAKEGSL